MNKSNLVWNLNSENDQFHAHTVGILDLCLIAHRRRGKLTI